MLTEKQKKFILVDEDIFEKEFNKYLFEIEKGKFINVKELLLCFEDSQKLVENLIKQLEEKVKEIDKLNNIINEAIKYIKQHCEIIRYEKENIDKIGKVEGIPLLNILELKEGNKDDKN